MKPGIINRRRFLLFALILATATGEPGANTAGAREPASAKARLRGEYGFLSCATLGAQPEKEIRARVAVMAKTFGIREFMFYDWFADYSTAIAGPNWTDPFYHRDAISRRTIEVSIDEIHRQGGRAWAYVQAVGAEEQNLEDPNRDIWKLKNAKGEWYWHPPGAAKPRFPTYFANAAWAKHMVDRWAEPVKQLGFDGIHWDTLGKIAGDYGAETAGIHAFIRTAKKLLRDRGLRQTMNMVDLAWWDRELVRDYLEFPYAEVWSNESRQRYFDEMKQPDMIVVRGVIAMYPSVAVPPGATEADVICNRRVDALKHRLVPLLVGDGNRRMKHEYWPETVPLSDEVKECLRTGVD
ncbi:MAG TPA: glycoside hydrolase family 66 protein [Chthoniobacterales bacterium]|nr:glycoside hydrolase family 66 protein [Chthoniobacterales bacterium]